MTGEFTAPPNDPWKGFHGINSAVLILGNDKG